MVFKRLEIRYKATNVAKINRKSIRGSVKTPKVVKLTSHFPRQLFLSHQR